MNPQFPISSGFHFSIWVVVPFPWNHDPCLCSPQSSICRLQSWPFHSTMGNKSRSILSLFFRDSLHHWRRLSELVVQMISIYQIIKCQIRLYAPFDIHLKSQFHRDGPNISIPLLSYSGSPFRIQCLQSIHTFVFSPKNLSTSHILPFSQFLSWPTIPINPFQFLSPGFRNKPFFILSCK